MTSMGLAIPPDQKASQIRSIWFLISPVNIVFQILEKVEAA